MTTVTNDMVDADVLAGRPGRPSLDQPMGLGSAIIFMLLLAGGLLYVAYSIYGDIQTTGAAVTTWLPFLLLGVALLIALGFEFVNGFHDTANAVATVIYTHSLPPQAAVIWSGVWNFLGVLTSNGLVAFTIVSLLPVELILQVGSGAGFAMVFALLIAAIIWNLGTWFLGLPASSSHTLVGSIIGVGVANAFMRGRDGTAGVNWDEATKVFETLAISPVFGFVLAALLLLLMKFVIRVPALYAEPKGSNPPPLWIRGILVLTCTLVSFFHGSNDGGKGMGLIMLILIGTVPTAYALNHSPSANFDATLAANSAKAASVLSSLAANGKVDGDPRGAVTDFVRTKKLEAQTVPALSALVADISAQVNQFGAVAKVPAAAVKNTRNDMYLASEAVKALAKSKDAKLTPEAIGTLKDYNASLDDGTKFIPLWVKVAIAVALGLGTMIGWKRIVITVGEKIGKAHLTYAQGAAAEIIAASTIGAASQLGLPVSTTHVLSSGIAGAMAANGSGLQWSTVANMLMAWILTLPVAMVLSGSLYWALSHVM